MQAIVPQSYLKGMLAHCRFVIFMKIKCDKDLQYVVLFYVAGGLSIEKADSSSLNSH